MQLKAIARFRSCGMLYKIRKTVRYCDMAMGIAKMMNIQLPINFDSPYKSVTILEFWDRWHITLTRFFTKYLYIPLGGSKKGMRRTCLNTIAVFLVSGLWHGAGWTFLLWGGLHGMFSVITKKWKPFFEQMHPALGWLLTFGFVNGAWIFFRADSIMDGLRIGWRIISLNLSGISENLVSCFQLTELRFLADLFRYLTGFDICGRFPCFFLLLFLGGALLSVLGGKNACEKMADNSLGGIV